MSAVDIAGSAFRIFGELAPVIGKLIASGVTEQTLTATLIAAAQATATERVNARAGKTTPPLVVEAVHLGDAATRLRAKGRPDFARTLEDMASDLRKDAAAAAPVRDDDTPASER